MVVTSLIKVTDLGLGKMTEKETSTLKVSFPHRVSAFFNLNGKSVRK